MVFLMVFDVICCSFVSRPSLSKLYSVLETNPLVFDILVSILLTLVTNLSHRVFLTISLSTTLISLFKSSGKAFSLSASDLSTSDFSLAKSDFATKLDVSTPVTLFKSALFDK